MERPSTGLMVASRHTSMSCRSFGSSLPRGSLSLDGYSNIQETVGESSSVLTCSSLVTTVDSTRSTFRRVGEGRGNIAINCSFYYPKYNLVCMSCIEVQ